MELERLALPVLFLSLWCVSGMSPKIKINRPIPPVEAPFSGIIKAGATGRAAQACGIYTLSNGESISLDVSTTPWEKPPGPVCKWTFRGTSLQTRIALSCNLFTIKRCLGTTLEVVGGTLKKSYCGIISGLSEVSPTNQMDIILSTYTRGLAPNDGFSCTVRAADSSTGGSSGFNCSTITTGALVVDSSCYCGRRNPVTRIIGGSPTELHAYPWQVAISRSSRYRPYCGGSIISNKWILTAAHCIYGQAPADTLVVIGEHQWTSASETSATKPKEIQQVIIHPDYDMQTNDNDIALIELKSPIAFPSDNKIAPVCLPLGENLYENVNAFATGWGTLSYGGSQPSVLYEVNIPTMSNRKCSTLIDGITSNMLCAGQDQGGKDTCMGDSGGPLVTATAFALSMEQIGVASWGYGCGEAGKPGVYTRVTRYLTWIQNHSADSRYCARP